jgi:hypothetical protein
MRPAETAGARGSRAKACAVRYALSSRQMAIRLSAPGRARGASSPRPNRQIAPTMVMVPPP